MAFSKTLTRKSHEKSSVKASFVLIEQPESTLSLLGGQRAGETNCTSAATWRLIYAAYCKSNDSPRSNLVRVYVRDSQDFNQQLAHRCLQSIFLPAAAGPKLSHAHKRTKCAEPSGERLTGSARCTLLGDLLCCVCVERSII
jgi:hypothetical protein